MRGNADAPIAPCGNIYPARTSGQRDSADKTTKRAISFLWGAALLGDLIKFQDQDGALLLDLPWGFLSKTEEDLPDGDHSDWLECQNRLRWSSCSPLVLEARHEGGKRQRGGAFLVTIFPIAGRVSPPATLDFASKVSNFAHATHHRRRHVGKSWHGELLKLVITALSSQLGSLPSTFNSQGRDDHTARHEAVAVRHGKAKSGDSPGRVLFNLEALRLCFIKKLGEEGRAGVRVMK